MGAHTKLADTVPESQALSRGRDRWRLGLVAAVWSIAAPFSGAVAFELGSPSGFGAGSSAPEIAHGLQQSPLVRARELMVVTANPRATEAAYRILDAGGTAIDAAVAAQMVLNVVEPQSSGIGGGGFLLYYDARLGKVSAYDGRELAPTEVSEEYLRTASPDGGQIVPDLRHSGRAVGVPGLVALLEKAHRQYGSKPWASLFAPAMQLSLEGFPVSPRLAASIRGSAESLRHDPEAAAYFFTPMGQPLPVGWHLYSPHLAQTLARIAAQGTRGFYEGEVAEALIKQVANPPSRATPGEIQLADLANYEVIERPALCVPYRDWSVCGFPPPSSGGVTVAQILGILDRFNLSAMVPTQLPNGAIVPDPAAVHLISEASRLAYADRNHYLGDPAFVPNSEKLVERLLNPNYLAARAKLIDWRHSMKVAEPGLGELDYSPDSGHEREETTHLSIVDRYGNAVAMTTSLEGGFGSYMMVEGFLLNNQLSDFNVQARDASGRSVANGFAAGKRPRSSMAPTMVFEREPGGVLGRLVLVTGSPGGAAIIQFVTNHLVAMLDWGLNPAEAMMLAHFGAFNDKTTVLEDNPQLLPGAWPESVVRYLQDAGHEVVFQPRPSGLATIVVSPPTLVRPLSAAADTRREGTARGY